VRCDGALDLSVGLFNPNGGLGQAAAEVQSIRASLVLIGAIDLLESRLVDGLSGQLLRELRMLLEEAHESISLLVF
jgi:hypothetical protein